MQKKIYSEIDHNYARLESLWTVLSKWKYFEVWLLQWSTCFAGLILATSLIWIFSLRILSLHIRFRTKWHLCEFVKPQNVWGSAHMLRLCGQLKSFLFVASLNMTTCSVNRGPKSHKTLLLVSKKTPKKVRKKIIIKIVVWMSQRKIK